MIFEAYASKPSGVKLYATNALGVLYNLHQLGKKEIVDSIPTVWLEPAFGLQPICDAADVGSA